MHASTDISEFVFVFLAKYGKISTRGKISQYKSRFWFLVSYGLSYIGFNIKDINLVYVGIYISTPLTGTKSVYINVII